MPDDKTFEGVVREYLPKIGDEFVDFILWEKTGFPCFWETEDVEACLRKQIIEFLAELKYA